LLFLQVFEHTHKGTTKLIAGCGVKAQSVYSTSLIFSNEVSRNQEDEAEHFRRRKVVSMRKEHKITL